MRKYYCFVLVSVLLLMTSCPVPGRLRGPFPSQMKAESSSYIPLYGMIMDFRVESCKQRKHYNSRNLVDYSYFSPLDTIWLECVYVDTYVDVASDENPYGIDTLDKGAVTCLSLGDNKLVFDSIAAKHGDTAFNGIVYAFDPTDIGGGVYHFERSAPMSEVVSINVVANQPWDEEHPAGTSLNDIIIYNSQSLRRFINAGYKGEEEEPVEKYLSEMTEQDYILNLYSPSLNGYGSQFSLRFVSAPTLSDDLWIAVEIQTDDGRVFKPVSRIVCEK